MMPWVLGTRSTGKLRELRPWFAARGIEVVTLADAGVPESDDEAAIEAFDTFRENALAKARHFHRLLGRPVIADDSGLAVAVLGGRPGVRSRRIAADLGITGPTEDAANNAAVLQLLRATGTPGPWRAAYVCAMAYVDDRQALVVEGEAGGEFVAAPRGSGGFGYDPHLHSDELGVTFAEAALDVKNAISHRARACAALLAVLRDVGVVGATGG